MSVYFAQVGDLMKIGHSADPHKRAQTITRLGKRPDSVPFKAEVSLIGWVPGDEWREREFHVEHLEQRVEGEWFRLGREVAEEHIWTDPRGVSIRGMSAMAVFACMRHPELTRDEIEAAGIPIKPKPLEEALEMPWLMPQAQAQP